MGQTEENLSTAFAGESQANRKYLAFAKQAEKDGHKQIAKLFRAAAVAETVHAHAHLTVMGGVKSTDENLKAAIEGEHFEFKKMYPEFLEQAKEEAHTTATMSFERALKVEKIHHNLYSQALQGLESRTPTEAKPYYVCQVCGNTVENEAPETCPICETPKQSFMRID